MDGKWHGRFWLSLIVLAVVPIRSACAQKLFPFILPEQRSIRVRDPSELPKAYIPNTPPPPTVSDRQTEKPPVHLSLDAAILVALKNAEVIRVLAGVQAISSGSTIYDAAITNNGIDEQRGRFDPTIDVQNNFNRNETPAANFDPFDPTQSVITGLRTDGYNYTMGLSKTNTSGGTLSFGVISNPQRFQPGIFPLNPQNRPSVDLSYTQPLLQGGGFRPNRAPIVIASIETERSYFRFKDSVQESVRGVIEGYWAVVFARVDLWARQQQVEQAEFAYDRAMARKRADFANAAEVAQTRLAFANFRANLITAKANLLQREAAMRNILGIPPSEPMRIVPTTKPTTDRFDFGWNEIVQLAEERRPDLIELKLIIEADQQRLLQARNQALPRVDATALYRWNGLEGELPNGQQLSTRSGEFTDWTLGVNFSVPIGLRQGRASMRSQQLIIARDRANLEQGLHSTMHVLAANLRNLAQFFEQYEAFKEAREASRENLNQQLGEYRSGRVIFLNVLQAITDWGNAVSAEAQALAQYNTALASIERETGTILETHGVTFVEERYGAIGPLGRLAPKQPYPKSLRPGGSAERYPRGTEPAENVFDLEAPYRRSEDDDPQNEELLPPVRPAPPIRIAPPTNPLR